MTDIAHPARRTAATNTATTYGWVERAFHWSIAVLIVTAAALGVVAYEWPYGTDAALRTKATLFSAHKTTGLAVFFVALARIAWAVLQPRPRPLHPDRRLESFAAATVHWGGGGGAPLRQPRPRAPCWAGRTTPPPPASRRSGGRSARPCPSCRRTRGSAPRWRRCTSCSSGCWPDRSPCTSRGAVKHAVVDGGRPRWPACGAARIPAPLPPGGRGHALPALVAAGVWGVALAAGLLTAPQQTAAGAAADTAVAGAVQLDGAGGHPVDHRDAARPARHRQLRQLAGRHRLLGVRPAPTARMAAWRVSVDTGSLTLGSVTGQATGDEFLSSGRLPHGDLRRRDPRPGPGGGRRGLRGRRHAGF